MEFDKIFKALGDPIRLKILETLPDGPQCEAVCNVNELVEELGCSQPNISHHLRILKEAGLVKCRKMCCSIYYYKEGAMLKEAQQFLSGVMK